jgi:hypothetical protein
MGFNSAFKGLKPICHLLALLGAHHILHVSRIRVNIYVPIEAVISPMSSIKVCGIVFLKLLLGGLIHMEMISLTGYIFLNPELVCENITPN